jgi:cell wall-associated NlpC family hydrolase
MCPRRHLLALLLTALLALPAVAQETPSLVAADATTDGMLTRYSDAAQALVDQGLSYLGIPYRFGGSSPESGFDCSGLVSNVFHNVLGFELPRTADGMAHAGQSISPAELQPGDLVFFNTMRRAFSHVGIYVGDGQFLHAPAAGGRVRLEELSASYWARRFTGARRISSALLGTR